MAGIVVSKEECHWAVTWRVHLFERLQGCLCQSVSWLLWPYIFDVLGSPSIVVVNEVCCRLLSFNKRRSSVAIS